MIVDLFFHHMKHRSQDFVGRRHPRNLFASSFEHSQVVLTARRFTRSRMHQGGEDHQRAHHAVAFFGDMPMAFDRGDPSPK